MGCNRMRSLAVLVLVSLVQDGSLTGSWPLQPVDAWDQWDRADHGLLNPWGSGAEDLPSSVWENLIGGAVPVAGASAWRAEQVAAATSTPSTTTATPAHSALACNFSEWRPVASPWPERLQESWDRVDVVQPVQPALPAKPFRPSQPLVERPAPAATPRLAPPCYAAIQLPRPRPGAPAEFQLLYSPNPSPSASWDSGAETSRCQWTLVAPPGYNVSAAVTMGPMGAWGPGRGSVHLYAQSADGELQPVFSLRAPAQSSAEVHTHSNVAVLSTALPASATFTLRLAVTPATPALADTLQPPGTPSTPSTPSQQQRPWGQAWGQQAGKPGSASWNPKPYPASSGNVDAEAVDLTHQHQTANCVVQQQSPAAAPGAATPPPRDEHPAPNAPAAPAAPVNTATTASSAGKPTKPQPPPQTGSSNKPPPPPPTPTPSTATPTTTTTHKPAAGISAATTTASTASTTHAQTADKGKGTSKPTPAPASSVTKKP